MTTIPKLDGDGRIQITPSELEKCVDTSKWFISSVKVPALAQTLLENYSSLAPGEVAPHVTDLVSGIHHHIPRYYDIASDFLFLLNDSIPLHKE